MAHWIPSLVIAACFAAPASANQPQAEPAARAAGARPVFLENRGQWSEAARFRRGTAQGTAWLVDDGWWLVLRGEPGTRPESGTPAVALQMQFEGARDVRPLGVGEAPGTYNFLRGADPAGWVRGARSSGQVVWSSLYDGLDLVARVAPAAHAGSGGSGGSGTGLFEYDLELAPGADLAGVRIALAGHTGLRLDAAGRLVIETAVGPLVQAPPVAWQWRGDERVPLECRFRVLDERHFGFEAPGRDPELRSVVDPALVFSTYLSGQSSQDIEQVSAGPGGTLYVAGWTLSDDFPSTAGAFQQFSAGMEDAFVTRLSADGTQLIWSTFLGGGDTEVLAGLEVDGAGVATLCGQTRSTDFPVTAGAYDTTPNGFTDGWVAQLAASGDALVWSSYLGGGLNDACAALALDALGRPTVAGRTNGSGFPALKGFDTSFNGGVFSGDAFVARFSADGKALLWSTFLGGSFDDAATAVAVESTGEVSVSGTTSGGFPVTSGALDTQFSAPLDTFVARISASGGSLSYATYFGNFPVTTVRALALDGSGEVVLLGRTEDPAHPLTAGAHRSTFEGPAEGFYTQLSANGKAVVLSTFVGGNDDDEVLALARDPSGRVWLAGNTTSDDLPTTPGSYSPVFHDNLGGLNADAFMLRFDAALGAVDYGTYFGTSATDTIADFTLDASGAMVFAGNTNSFQFPTTTGAVQESFNPAATSEGFAVRLTTLLHPITYGSQRVVGTGKITWSGFPSLTESFQIQVQSATPNKPAILFHGFAPQAKPFYGRTILVQPPLFRQRPVKCDAFGYKSLDVVLSPSWLGQTVYYQWWYKDPFNPKKKTGLSDALRVLVHP